MKKIVSRILILALLISTMAFLVTGCGQSQTKEEPKTSEQPAQGEKKELVKIRLANLQLGLSTIPHLLAIDKGIFAKHGIELEIINFAKGGAEATAGVASGQVDMGSYGTPILTGISKGLPIKIVAAPPVKSNPFVLVATNDIKSIQDLKGKTIATGAFGGGNHQSFVKILEANGLKESDVKVVATGGTDEYMILKSGKVAAVNTTEPTVTRLERDGVGHVLAKAEDVYGKYEHSYVFATDELIKNNPEAIRNFLAASREAYEYVRDHQDEVVAYSKEKLNMDEGIIRDYFKKDMEEWDLSYEVDVEGTENAVKILKELEEIDANVVFDKNTWINTSFLK